MRQCNICILIHDKKPTLEILPDFLKKLELIELLPKIIYTFNNTNEEVDFKKFINNSIQHRDIKITNNIISTLSKEYDNDLPLFYIESNYELDGNFADITLENIEKPIYIKEIYDKYSYFKLFYLPYYLIKNDINIEILKFNEISVNETFSNFTNTNNFTREELLSYIDNFVRDNQIVLFAETLKTNNSITGRNITTYINEDMDKSEKWLVNYFFGLSFYHCENYKKAKEYFNNCISLIPNKREAIYFLAKINLLNEKYTLCYDIIKDLEVKENETMFTNNEISNFHLQYLKILVNVKLNNISDSLKYANSLIDSQFCSKQYRRIILQYINKLQVSKSNDGDFKDNDDILKKISQYKNLVYDKTTHYKIMKDTNCIDLKKFDDNFTITNDGVNNTISDSKINSFSCLNHKNSKVLIVNELYPLVINSIKDNSLVKILEYTTPDYLKNFTFVSKFVKYNNIYIALITHKIEFCNFNDKLYKLITIDSETLKPLNISSLFKINIKTVKDIFIIEDHLLILGDNSHTYISLCEFYIDENLNIDYSPKIILEKNESISINIKSIGYDITCKTYKNYIINGDKPKNKLVIDWSNNTITNSETLFSQLIDEFVYLPNNKSVKTKSNTIAFYSSKTDIMLQSYLENKNISIDNDNDYTNSKYLIITTFELENLSNTELSDIISSKTLVVTLLEEEEVNNTTNIKYKTNKYLNKLFLFNIVKNEDYMEFIYSKIIEEDQYMMREKYFDIDLSNIYIHSNLFELVIRFLESENKINNMLDITKTSNNYKIELLNKLHRKTENSCIIEVLKFILVHNQDIIIFSEDNEVDELIFKLNILGEFHKLAEVDTENFIGCECVVILNNYKCFKDWKHLYNKNTLIYIISDNRIIYSSLTNS